MAQRKKIAQKAKKKRKSTSKSLLKTNEVPILDKRRNLPEVVLKSSFPGISHKKKILFLQAMRRYGTVLAACRAVGIARRTHYDWFGQRDKKTGELTEEAKHYQLAFRDAQEDVADNLERAAMQRAVKGQWEPVVSKGRVVTHVKRYSDTLLIFLLKGNKPEKYHDRVESKVEHEVTLKFLLAEAQQIERNEPETVQKIQAEVR